jgi:ubiquinol-cytochrome c reductase iron-sulfur subunit
VSRVKDWIVALGLLFLRRRARDRARAAAEDRERIVAEAPPNRAAETAVVVLLLGAALCAVAFVVLYAIDDLPNQTQYLGLALGLAFALVSAALTVVAHRLVATEEIEEEYPPDEHADEQRQVAQIVEESGAGLTRKRLLGTAAGTAAGALAIALVTPAASLGPVVETGSLYQTPWRRGRRLVDEQNRPMRADDIEQAVFYTAYPEDGDREKIGAPLVVVRVDPGRLRLPRGREGWAPEGILAYSKICTHAGCAIALYRSPLYEPVEPGPALVCPCHYSTFDPATGGTVVFGPAGRPPPQLPLVIDGRRELRAGGNFSGAVGPGWWGVRSGKPRS